MNYRCHYNNSTFPYNQSKKNIKKEPQIMPSYNDNSYDDQKQTCSSASNIFSSILESILSPIEKSIGRKICFDDLILVALIYLLYTEKDNDNNVLLLCLLFLLF